jgi:hypothetical protein
VLSFRPQHGAVAQLVAHLVRNEGVRGSSPLSSTDTEGGLPEFGRRLPEYPDSSGYSGLDTSNGS